MLGTTLIISVSEPEQLNKTDQKQLNGLKIVPKTVGKHFLMFLRVTD